MPRPDHDVVVLGAGTAGLTASRYANLLGARTLLVERERLLGGECTFTGCVPSKALIEAAKLYWQIQRATRMGIHVDGLRLDFSGLMAHKDRVIADINRDESDESMTEAGIAVLHGTARFTGAHSVEVDGREITFDRCVLAQGTDPNVPRITGLDTVPFLTNETVFDQTSLPRRLIVLGAGPIGLELGQCFLRLGSEVVALGSRPTLLPREDAEASALVLEILQREGMEVHTNATAERVEATTDGGIRVHFRIDGEPRSVDGDRLLVATGRKPRLEGLGLDALGVTTGDRGITVDEHCRTNLSHVFAAGDITGTYLFTHWAAHQGRVAGGGAAGKKHSVDDRVVPWVTFLDPEVARVGLTEDDARARHRDVEVARFPFSRVDRARIMGETDGWIKIVVAKPPVIGDATGGTVVGAHIVGPHAGEMLHEVVLSMQAKTFAGRLAQAIHAYPTLSLGIQQAAAQLFPGGRAVTDAAPLPPLD